jgi:hypothetical protein
VRFERLAPGHVVAAVAALVLLLVMAMDWYGSTFADEARQIEQSAKTTGAEGGEPGRAVQQDAERVIARDEKNAWQEQRTLDRVLLGLLLASVFLPLFAAAHRAAGRRATPPWTPSALTALVVAATAVLVAYRIVNEPGDDATTTVKIGAPLGLIALCIVGLGAVAAFRGEARWMEMRRAAGSAPAGASGRIEDQPAS